MVQSDETLYSADVFLFIQTALFSTLLLQEQDHLGF